MINTGFIAEVILHDNPKKGINTSHINQPVYENDNYYEVMGISVSKYTCKLQVGTRWMTSLKTHTIIITGHLPPTLGANNNATH